MNKLYKYIIGLSLILSLSSCNDFLDREPQSSVTSKNYLNTENELGSFGAALYTALPSHQVGAYSIGTFGKDNNSDNQTAARENDLFIPDGIRVAKSGGWNFGRIRNCNYFLEQVLPKYEENRISGTTDNIKHYIGEIYFFRAFLYFEFLKQYGDFPIVTKTLSEDYDELAHANKRQPRNMVARFIIEDLDKAIELLKMTPPQTNRITKRVAQLLKSRVALYEGTWLTYHAGTDRVPGGNGWPGASAEHLKDFTIDLDQEITYFLSQAKEAAKEVADNTSLGEYESMFNSIDLSKMEEVLLWREYDISLNNFHYVVSYLQTSYPGGNGCGNSGYTRSLVESFLMNNGLPIYAANSSYQGDRTLLDVVEERDSRLRQSMSVTGDPINPLITFTRPGITLVEENKNTTGYCIRKGLNQDPNMGLTQPCNTASVVFRAAEAYLNYMEANYVLDGSLDANSQKYWKALRERAQVDSDYNKTISATDLSKENDLAIYSGSQLIDATLYNIRRERRSEFIAEGMRLDDLFRWRALDKMENYHVEGFNLWDEQYKDYNDLQAEGESNEPNVSRKSHKYLRPFQIRRNNKAFNGYTFMKAHYLSPIAYDVIRLATPEKGGDVSTSYVYQNPGWDILPGSTANK